MPYKKENKIMKTEDKNSDEVTYMRIRYGVRIFGVEMDKDIHSNSTVDVFLWSRAKRRQFSRQFKMQFAQYSYNHNSHETVKFMIEWVADYLEVNDNVRNTAIELALEYDPTYKLKGARLIEYMNVFKKYGLWVRWFREMLYEQRCGSEKAGETVQEALRAIALIVFFTIAVTIIAWQLLGLLTILIALLLVTLMVAFSQPPA